MKSKNIFALATLAVSYSLFIASGANADNTDEQSIDQGKVCHIEASTTAASCEAGDILLFIPRRITSNTTKESIILASLVCNYKFEIMHSSDALSCVFTTSKRSQWARFGME